MFPCDGSRGLRALGPLVPWAWCLGPWCLGPGALGLVPWALVPGDVWVVFGGCLGGVWGMFGWCLGVFGDVRGVFWADFSTKKIEISKIPNLFFKMFR